MKLLQSGVAKSGNYWLYTILQSLLRHEGLPTHTYIQSQPIHTIAHEWALSFPEQASVDTIDINDNGVFYRISSAFRWPVQDLDAYLARATHVWTHSGISSRTDSVFSKFDKIVYIVRDPRDVVLSTSRFLFTPYMKTFYPHQHASPEDYLRTSLAKQTIHWRENVGGHLAAAQRHNMYIVFYERLLANLREELKALCGYLDIEPSDALLDAVQQDVSFENMQENSPGHVRKGTPRQWVEQLSAEQKASAVQQAGPLLELLHYPRSTDGMDEELPYLPDPLTAERIAAARRSPKQALTVRSALSRIARRVLD
jgi:aryl sulfotransferase